MSGNARSRQKTTPARGTAGLERSSRDQRIAARLEIWFQSVGRDLPWRRPMRAGGGRGRRDPYASLVAEMMLQQTQVSRVLEYFPAFMRRFPTIERLARAPEGDVLAAWAGLGYYRRALNLHAAVKEIVDRFGGGVPASADDLLSLPGVGRYTAGAIASIVFGHREPIVDGNVRRVLQRLEAQRIAPDSWAWERATALVNAAIRPGVMNEGLMELGATVCLPSAPKCEQCPLWRLCSASLQRITERVPAPRPRPERIAEFHSVVIVRDSRGRLLVEQRPRTGLWAAMWQAPTIERPRRAAAASFIRRKLGVSDLNRIDRFEHGTSHRMIRFDVWLASAPVQRPPQNARWVTAFRLRRLPLSNPQRRALFGERR